MYGVKRVPFSPYSAGTLLNLTGAFSDSGKRISLAASVGFECGCRIAVDLFCTRHWLYPRWVGGFRHSAVVLSVVYPGSFDDMAGIPAETMVHL